MKPVSHFPENGWQKYKQTTDATATVIMTIPFLSDSEKGLEIEVVGLKTDGLKALHLVRRATYKNDGGTLTKVGTYTDIHYERQDTSYSSTLAISGTDLQVKVTGKASTTIDWMCRVRSLKI